MLRPKLVPNHLPMLAQKPIIRKFGLLYALVGGLLFCCLSCRNSVVLYSYLPVDPHGWSCTDTLHFELSADSVAALHTYSLGVRFTEEVAFSGLWLVLEQRPFLTEKALQLPPPRRDTLYLPLTDDKGKWNATGVVCHEVQAVCTAAQTPPNIPLHLLVYHIMPKQEISGILEVGLKVE